MRPNQDSHTLDDGCRCNVRSNMPSSQRGSEFDLPHYTSYRHAKLFLSFFLRPPSCSRRPEYFASTSSPTLLVDLANEEQALCTSFCKNLAESLCRLIVLGAKITLQMLYANSYYKCTWTDDGLGNRARCGGISIAYFTCFIASFVLNLPKHERKGMVTFQPFGWSRGAKLPHFPSKHIALLRLP